jgi:ABC-type lipoprotein release transport system permease subunit
MNIISLASRNVYRSGPRSLVTIVAMAFACAMMIVFTALMEGFVAGSERNIVSMNVGDIQIHSLGYHDDPDIYNSIVDSRSLASRIRKIGFTASERQFAFGLLASDQSSAGVQLRGIDLTFEHTVTQIDQHLMSGAWLDLADQHGVVIGKKLARLLDTSLGDELIFVGQTADGYMADDAFHVRGILKIVSASIDNAGVYMSSEMLRELIALPEDAHEIVLMRTNRTSSLVMATEQVATLATEQLEVMNWQQLMPVISHFMETAQIQTFIMLLFTYIAVASVVLSAMLMSVFERINVFGIMKAIGVRPWQIMQLIYAETMIHTLLASVIGVVMGGAISWYLQLYGIDISSIAKGISFAGIALYPIWYAQLSTKSLVIPVLFLFAIAAIAVIYPAAKVALIRPLVAIHHR